MFLLAKGRMRQLRLHAVNQAALVGAMFGDVRPELLQQFVETGTMEARSEVVRPSPAAMERMFSEMQGKIDDGQSQ